MSNPLGDLISTGEGSYNSFNRGNAGDSHGQTIDFSQMTLGTIQKAQHLGRHDPQRLFAVGKYQIIPDTMDDAIRQLKLDPNQKFTPDLQERIFADYLIAGKRPQIEAYIKGEPGATLHAAQKAACQEWASVEDPDTPGKPYAPYLSHGNNHSSITSSQIADALNTMRTAYRTDISEGMSPQDAWHAVTSPTVSHQQAAAAHANPTDAARGNPTLQQGAHGDAVATLQTHLAQLGYTDHRGQPLAADGVYGIDTRHAVECFQHDRHLTVDGIAGPATMQLLDEAAHARESRTTPPTSFDDPHHPDHALFTQAWAGVRQLDAQQGRSSDTSSLNLAAALTATAKREGLTRIDHVALGDDAGHAFAMQRSGSPAEPAKLASVDTLTAVRTPMAQSVADAAALPVHSASVVEHHAPPAPGRAFAH